ncbi:UbiA prenyltransferase family protein [Sediminicola luteus]|uniref:Prenyltransferase n=1 Tax=Sediminicola luteus TaxID=319238 RepID=A0A2A4G9B0_9FLAO|nr:hypothetical protein [Sediminicola luteus]PCE64568.1 hypothetical protein B7P33_09825 [Sediminicola luteus]
MKVWVQGFQWYLEASVHVALAVVSLTLVSSWQHNISVNVHLISAQFFGAIAVYNFIKYGIEAQRYVFVPRGRHKKYFWFSIPALLLALYSGWFLWQDLWVVFWVLAILVGLYALPMLKKGKNLRSIGWLKVFIVALVWAIATVIVPVYQKEATLLWDTWVEFVQRFLFVCILMLPFELRDMEVDPAELRTLPQRYGVKKVKVLGVVWVVAFFLLIFFKDIIGYGELWRKAFLAAILLLMLWRMHAERSRYFASFWVEAIPMFWLLLYLGFPD